MQGTIVGSYQITCELGRGGMGAVYLAEHRLIGRKAAIKTLLPEFCQNEAIVKRFFNEAKAATAAKHPGIVEIYDFGFQDDGTAYIAMEYLEGETLKARLRHSPRIHAGQSFEIIRQIAAALDAAHSKGVVHRDLKPDNIFLVPDPEIGERVKILDFGIAKLAQSEEDGSHRTRTGTIMGTPSYMAPEQCRGAGKVDSRADLYSVGCILFEMLCGQPPFVREGSGAVMGAHMYEPPPMPRSFDSSMPPALEALVLRLLAKDPGGRFASAGELVRALPRFPTNSELAVAPSLHEGPQSSPFVHTAPGAPESTTLSRASAAMMSGSHGGARFAPRGPSRRRMVAIASASVALGLAGAAVYSMMAAGDLAPSEGAGASASTSITLDEPGNGDEQGEPSAPPAVQTDGDSAAHPEQEPEAAGDLQAQPEHDATQSEPATVTVQIESTPSGADVFMRGSDEPIGRTPFTRQADPDDGVLEFVVKKRGYEAQTVEFDASRGGTRTVALEKRQRVRPRSSSRPRVTPAAKRRIDDQELQKGSPVDPF